MPINFSETIHSSHFKYLIQTSTNGFSNKIISAVFKDGDLIFSSDFFYGREASEGEIRKLAEQFHQQKKVELHLIFSLLPKYRQSTNFKIIELVGQALLRKNFAEEAIHLFRYFLEKNTHAATIYFFLGQAYFETRQNEPAIECLRNAVNFQPDYADYRNKLGLALLANNECHLALEQFKAAISRNVYYAEAHFHSALTYIKNSIVRDDYTLSVNMEEKTLKALEMATRLNPAYKREEYLTAMDFFNARNYPDALKMFSTAQKMVTKPDPRELIHNFYLRLISGEDGIDIVYIWNYIKELRNLIRDLPNYADLYNDLGVAYTIMGTYFQKEATQIFNEALQLNPDYQKARKNKKLLKYENRGLDYLVDFLLELQADPVRKKQGLTIQHF
jgi:tetratricopeptide (TPR) repeat protein